MQIRILILLLCIAPNILAQELPSIGEEAQVAFSPIMEKRVGEAIMRDIRLHEPSYIDDPEINSYLNRLGALLVSQSVDARQDFVFFVLRDPTLNAFAMPGGYIGVHTGLIMTAQSESELAAVLAHEISHVTQRHLARQQSLQSQAQLPMLLSLAFAILASHGHSDLAQGALMTGQAASIQHQLNFSRDFEREADRLGIQLLERAGFDIRAMSEFFEKMQKYGRLYENNAPGYLRTHPLTTERIADIENRIQLRPYGQVIDSLDFSLVRAKLKASEGTPLDSVIDFESQLRERKFANERAARYGYAIALSRSKKFTAAEHEISELRRLQANSAMIEALAAELRKNQNDFPASLKILRAAISRYPQERSLAYAQVETLLAAGLPKEALLITKDELLMYSSDPRMQGLQARAYAVLGKHLQQHRAQAEVYALQGQLMMAIEQLQMAQKANDGDFFEQSQVDARLFELKQRQAEEAREKKN